nr:MAG TPA: endonuclease [Caudoviricetes sp.]
MPRKYEPGEKEKIVQLYKEGMAVSKISQIMCRHVSTIKKILAEQNIVAEKRYKGPKREFSQEEDELIIHELARGSGYNYVARLLDCCKDTVERRAQELQCFVHSYRHKNRDMNENYFEVIDSEEKAYFLGLLYTDGSVRCVRENSKQVRLQLQLQDEPIIQRFKEVLNADCQIVYDKRPGKECAGIEITNQKLFDDLGKYGIIPNKTYASHSLPSIPEDFIIPFLRGLFDGDGVFSFADNYDHCSVGYVAYYEAEVQQFQEYIDFFLNKTEHNIISHKDDKTGSSYRCSWGGRNQSLRILTLLYRGATIYLPRKYEKYQKLLATYSENEQKAILKEQFSYL